jgi:uncharacterized protein YndB with AHSA1/START domain
MAGRAVKKNEKTRGAKASRVAAKAPKKVAKKAPKKVAEKAPKKVAKRATARVLEELRLYTDLPVPPQAVFEAWLDSGKHTAFTGAEALIEPRVGGKHSAWSGYIEGTISEIAPERLAMTWRTTEFSDADPDSHLEVKATPRGTGSRLEIVHTRLPVGGAEKYSQGWRDFYFTPMATYFGRG